MPNRTLLSAAALTCLFAASPALAETVKDGAGKATLEVVSAKRTEAETLTVTVRVANTSPSSFSVVLGNMQLIDLPGRRAYSPGLTGPSCGVPAGETRQCWAMFAAPPAALKHITVKMSEDFPLVPVEITE